jgi:hypothetical protein
VDIHAGDKSTSKDFELLIIVFIPGFRPFSLGFHFDQHFFFQEFLAGPHFFSHFP